MDRSSARDLRIPGAASKQERALMRPTAMVPAEEGGREGRREGRREGGRGKLWVYAKGGRKEGGRKGGKYKLTCITHRGGRIGITEEDLFILP
jgi:hypothetical protein